MEGLNNIVEIQFLSSRSKPSLKEIGICGLIPNIISYGKYPVLLFIAVLCPKANLLVRLA